MIEVVIPVIHTNELWRANLNSVYREIPVRQLCISDGGCKDDSIKIARSFPRVEVLDQRWMVSIPSRVCSRHSIVESMFEVRMGIAPALREFEHAQATVVHDLIAVPMLTV